MKTRAVLASLVAFFAGLALCFAADLNLGTWKLNEAKSKLSPGFTKDRTVVIEKAEGKRIKATGDGVDKDGKAIHYEWVGMFDGKDYPVTGSPVEDARSFKTVDNHTTDFTGKKNGQVVVTGGIVVSDDHRTRTVTTTVTDSNGRKKQEVAVYDRQ